MVCNYLICLLKGKHNQRLFQVMQVEQATGDVKGYGLQAILRQGAESFGQGASCREIKADN
jgi:hypothetical protein